MGWGLGARRPWMSLGGLGPRERRGRSRAGAPLKARRVPCAHTSGQGPFVHLSVMIGAYLGRVRTKATGESEVRGSWEPPPLEE